MSCQLAQNPVLARIVARKLKGLCSPEQIAGRLSYTYPDDENYQVSHETIQPSLLPEPIECGGSTVQ
jgi:IS30 family transposase